MSFINDFSIVVRLLVVFDVKVFNFQLVFRVLCFDIYLIYIGKYYCMICNIGFYRYVKCYVLCSYLLWFWIGSFFCWKCRQFEGLVLSLIVKYIMVYKGEQCFFDDDSLYEWCQLFNGFLYLLREWFGVEDLDELFYMLFIYYSGVIGEFIVVEL